MAKRSVGSTRNRNSAKRSTTRRRGAGKAGPSTSETVAARRARARRIVSGLRRTYGPVTCALHHGSALELLVATILSAQSTDQNVNRITPDLFRKYPDAAAYAQAPIEELERDIHSTGFFRQKARSLQGAARVILERFGGGVPDTMEDLLELPGVARKTANVVLGTWFEKNEGVVVDTHVGRLAQRLALTWRSRNDKDAVKIESDLMELIPRKGWTDLSHLLIRHGRQVCSARKPQCSICSIREMCPSAGTFEEALDSPWSAD